MSKSNCLEEANNSKMKIYENHDKVDKAPNSNCASCFDISMLFFGIVLHFADVGFDFYVIRNYYVTGKLFYFSCTLACIMTSSIIITMISIRMYANDVEDGYSCRKYARVRIFLCLIGILIQSATLIRYIESFKHAIKSVRECKKENGQKHFKKMLNENSDVALLRVFECYLESSFQVALQITVLLIDYSYGLKSNLFPQNVMIALNFISMGYCMVNYNNSIRYDQSEKKNISILGRIVMFFWHLNLTVSRIFALAALGSMWPLWACVAVVMHWSAMTIWIALTNKANFCGNQSICEVFFSGAVGLIYVFNFIGLNDGPTRKSYVVFYTLCFAENLSVSIIWGVKPYLLDKNWLYYIFLTFPVLTFLISVICFAMYYKFLHPNKTEVED